MRATPFRWRDPASIPPRQWLYGQHLIRRFISMTVAPGGLGKSSLVLVEALALATGRPLLGITPPARCRVWVWNGEDPLEEVERRVAAICLHYGISREEIEGWLFLDSGRDSEIILARTTRAGTHLAVPVVEALTHTILENAIDVVFLDPFVSTHQVTENDNGAVDVVASAINRIAEETGAAFDLVHHVRKGQGSAGEHTVEDGRGAGALLAKARSARVLNQMTKEEAERAGVDQRRRYFRVDNGKANLAQPPERGSWFHLASISLGNGPESLLALSDHVAVVEPWSWPDPLEGMSVEDLRAAQAAVCVGGPWRENVQAGDWVGRPIAGALKLDPNEPQHRERIKKMLKIWIANGMFVIASGRDKKGNIRSFVELGELA
ncbi:AAA family ATPase [Methylobacterium platani]|uniref:AAA family ATPase n=1 Tax=Methylobacterium platani TaxID=427683 RepID=UPI0009E25195|nr:AAA family ATPase [Methylobacterium platani]